VCARGVGKVYGRQRALAAVDLTLRAGDCALLLGANGAGKSTLLGILSTLVRPSSGELTFGGRAADAEVRAAIGVIAHDALVYGDLSGRENLDFFAALYAIADGARAGALLERVGLADAADRPARTYSRGMLQRLAVARALLHAPRLLLLDEPFTGLDGAATRTLAALLEQERRSGAMLILATHDLTSVTGLATRALVLRRGRIAHDVPAPPHAEALRALYDSAVREEKREWPLPAAPAPPTRQEKP
jgi:heme exporter protein A